LAPVCQKHGVKLEKMEPFAIAQDAEAPAPADKPKTEPPDLTSIKNAAAMIQAGEVSDALPTPNGSLIVALEKRESPDPAKSQQMMTAFNERYLKNKRDVMFFEWVRDRQRAAGLGPSTSS
jgi:parvulin-like peptidyl-prolyl isomerase